MPQPNKDEPRKLPDEKTIRKIINSDDPDKLIEAAEMIGQALAYQVTTSQIRNIFGAARQIELRWGLDQKGAYRDAVLLRPKIGYQAKRERGRGMADLETMLVPALDEMSQTPDEAERRERYKRFVEFFEAIVAYHKKHGGN